MLAITPTITILKGLSGLKTTYWSSSSRAIPRRFTLTMEEIWGLQPRFEQVQRKRVFRLMAHPRFRAAFDFLLLRAAESPAIRQLGEWWDHAQQLPPETLAAALAGSASGGGASEASAMPKPRKRRKRKAASKSGGKSDQA